MSSLDQSSGSSTTKSRAAITVAPTAKTMSADFIPQPSPDFVITPAIQDLSDRAMAYLNVGYAVHLSGPSGTGKTTLALHIASQLARNCTLIHGDDEMKGSDLVGRDSGYRRHSLRDNYVSSILKTEETVSVMWTNNRLTTACEQGHTLVYDEFTRSPANANNILLSVLEEGILNIPSSSQEKGYIKVHPNFRAIFTSNPEEYVGVHKTQDALLDRMITLEVAHHDRETELAIVSAKSNRSPEDAAVIVDIVRSLRDRLDGFGGPTIRAALAIATISDFRGCSVNADDKIFLATCQDLLYFNATRQAKASIKRQDIESFVRKHATRSAPSTRSNRTSTASPIPASPSTSTSHRVATAMEQVASSIAELSHPSVGPAAPVGIAAFALANKDVAKPIVEESLAAKANFDDELSNSTTTRSMFGRSLPKPPSFDNAKVKLAT